MPEYIEREALCKYFKEKFEYYKAESEKTEGGGYVFDKKMQYAAIVAKHFLDKAKEASAADVVEVVHASWVWGKVCSSKGYCCTNCGAGFVGENAEWIAKEHDYCPKCGAKMDGERSESK